MERRDQIGKPIALHHPYGVCAMNHKGIDGSRHGRLMRRLISNGYLTLENKGTAAVAIILEAWIADNLT